MGLKFLRLLSATAFVQPFLAALIHPAGYTLLVKSSTLGRERPKEARVSPLKLDAEMKEILVCLRVCLGASNKLFECGVCWRGWAII
jgi:hypothetical protein